jgi:hypothetical protein
MSYSRSLGVIQAPAYVRAHTGLPLSPPARTSHSAQAGTVRAVAPAATTSQRAQAGTVRAVAPTTASYARQSAEGTAYPTFTIASTSRQDAGTNYRRVTPVLVRPPSPWSPAPRPYLPVGRPPGALSLPRLPHLPPVPHLAWPGYAPPPEHTRRASHRRPRR